jgi:hypothetical protein
MSDRMKLVSVLVAASVLVLGCGGDDATTSGGTPSGLPTQVSCDSATAVCTVQAPMTDPIVESFTMTADKQWLLKGGVFVGDDAAETVLTIEPGTTIYGETSSKAFLTVRRGSKIMATGTEAAPIVFTSSQAPGSRSRGDWGGVVLNGRAPINGCDAAPCEAEGEGGTGLYGGADPDDSSGVLRYVRVEFAGHPITEDNELNGIAFQGVGAGTTIEYIQIHMAADDGIEFFGGTVNFKYVLTTGISDDNLDWTDGWTGKGQFFVAQQYEDAGDNGIEADNNGDNNSALPRSLPLLSNLTLVGVPTSKDSDAGMLLREGTGAMIHNAIVIGFNDTCLDIDHDATFANAVAGGALTGNLTISHSIVSCERNFTMDEETDAAGAAIADPWSVEDFCLTLNAGNMAVDPQLTAPFDTASVNVTPASASPAIAGGVTPADPFFTQVTFIGGVDPASDWTQGWTTSARN